MADTENSTPDLPEKPPEERKPTPTERALTATANALAIAVAKHEKAKKDHDLAQAAELDRRAQQAFFRCIMAMSDTERDHVLSTALGVMPEGADRDEIERWVATLPPSSTPAFVPSDPAPPTARPTATMPPKTPPRAQPSAIEIPLDLTNSPPKP